MLANRLVRMQADKQVVTKPGHLLQQLHMALVEQVEGPTDVHHTLRFGQTPRDVPRVRRRGEGCEPLRRRPRRAELRRGTVRTRTGLTAWLTAAAMAGLQNPLQYLRRRDALGALQQLETAVFDGVGIHAAATFADGHVVPMADPLDPQCVGHPGGHRHVGQGGSQLVNPLRGPKHRQPLLLGEHRRAFLPGHGRVGVQAGDEHHLLKAALVEEALGLP
mmetsp:Transcript_48750/g.123655  ORF Transcript_48750/g.123655 Transcript_48750/m.123655 type:complete len:219 (-) Transcript_48750:299-955(-)